MGINSLLLIMQAGYQELLHYIQLALLLIAITIVTIIFYRINSKLMTPFAQMRDWALRMSSGNLSARIPVPSSGEFAELAREINTLGKTLEKLSREMDKQVHKQTERIEQKNTSLEILYDVAASINTSRDLNDLLERFLFTLQEVVHAKAAMVRLHSGDNQMRLVASCGLDEEIISKESLVSMDRCMCGKAMQQGELLSLDNISQCGEYAGQSFFKHDSIEMIAVPLQYRGKNLGVYNLFVEKPGLAGHEDIKEMLTTIGRHLGMAIEKARLDEAEKRHSISQERNMLSHELHDSLAQTLASLRFQVRMLDDSLANADNATAQQEVTQLRNGLDEAYAELRELLAHFRAPFDERGLIAAIENVIERFRKETGILIFFQNQWDKVQMSSVLEMQVLRIIQESLVNIRKHSQANAVRVFLKCDGQGTYTVLIEDDGVGIGEPVLHGKAGEHIGLSIMQERALRLGGELNIESEAGEGTRVVLTFNSNQTGQQELLGLN
jgi:two-component system nitrate/nitrite sensor histidine kinase NarX